jgi:uncharacterized protein (DUF697 family)
VAKRRAARSVGAPDDSVGGFAKALLDLLAQIPSSQEPNAENPVERARSVARSAAMKAALVSGTLSLPPGPAGWLTVFPDLMTVWKIQVQMVADIAGAFGQQACLTREQMLYCLFRHAAAQAVRDLVLRLGERVLVRRVSLGTLRLVVRKVGGRVTQRIIGKGVSRWLPVIGALGVAGYAYYDTAQVAHTAIELFGRAIDVEPEIAEIDAYQLANKPRTFEPHAAGLMRKGNA